MVKHGPNCLDGPVSRTSLWWTASAAGKPNPRSEAEGPGREDLPIRRELVERIRREIADGTYDTPEKWEAALDRLSQRLEQD